MIVIYRCCSEPTILDIIDTFSFFKRQHIAFGKRDCNATTNGFHQTFFLCPQHKETLAHIVAELISYSAAFWTVVLVNGTGVATYFLATRAFFLRRNLNPSVR